MNSSTLKKRACLFMLSIVAVLLLTMSTIAPASAAGVKAHRTLENYTIQGVWTSQWGDVTFIGPDDSLTGCWNKAYGIIDEGQYGSTTRWLAFSYHGNFEGGKKGTASLQLQDDNNTLEGTFKNEDGKGGSWTMHRKPKEQQPPTLSCETKQ